MTQIFKFGLLILLFLSCRNIDNGTIAPVKLKSIPDSAFWIGGADRGNWYLVESIHDHKNNAYIKVYNDQTGDLILSKRFFLVCRSDNQMWIDDLKEQILSFDGKKIILKSNNSKPNCWLQ